jgi:hypothetical protein
MDEHDELYFPVSIAEMLRLGRPTPQPVSNGSVQIKKQKCLHPTQRPNIVASCPLVLSRSLSSTCPLQKPLVHSSSPERLSTAAPPWHSSRRQGAGHRSASPPHLVWLPVFLLLHGSSCSPWSPTTVRLLHQSATCRGLLHRSDELCATSELYTS